jgi:hypothetical protein
VLPVAAASYHLYLFHRSVPEVLAAPLKARLDWGSVTGLAIVAGVTLGILVYTAQ